MKLDQYEVDALMEVTARPPLVFVEGRGSWIVDHRGKRYLDFVQGWAVNALGHCPPEIAQALAQQSHRLINPSPAYFNAPAVELAGKLARLSGLERVFLASSGAEANEGAIKLARKWGELKRGGAYEIVTFEGAFHGRTLATMAASGKAGWDKLFEPKVPGFPKARFEDIASVEAVITDKTVAVMLEPVQGEAGVVPASAAFLKAVRELCDRRGLLLILDEVQTGVGRTGRMFAFQHAGVRPDVMTLGKGIGGGVPLAALLASGRASCFAHGDQGGTYCGNPLMAAVGNAVIDVVSQPDFLAEVTAKGDYLAQRLRELSARRGLAGERGSGLLRALDLGRPVAAQVVDAARALEPEGLLLNAPRPSLLRFMPALNVTREEIDRMVAQLDGVLESLA
ncbi:acetylornithine transaminase [Betaproteobacteria bacterium PRO7]|jgi:acetylornithine/N-succinyldiaminopimelate aminotransferase|nr:acetylornithine transaminase [Betaproteobacteria bacterium PRO7]